MNRKTQFRSVPRSRVRKLLSTHLLLAIPIVVLNCVGSATPAVGADVLSGEISFNRDIRPILSDRCFACHGPDEHDRQASLRLDQSEGADGAYRSESGIVAIAPGSADDSEVWYRIISDDEDQVMPPPESHKKPLSKAEQELIRRWIDAGARYEQFWAFEPVRRPDSPRLKHLELKHLDWSRQPIDQHVMQRLDELGLEPASEADRRTLIRRLSLDLTGLPPTTSEVRAFLADQSSTAYENLVDRLLQQEQYGEHMARYWLDLVRFADTNGMHKDFYRNFVAYRNWVIRAFNDNLPYDDFVRYQLAGDLYEAPTDDQLIASGFNRLHLIIDRGTALPEESHFKNVIDRVTATGTVFMGLTVHCASCHDHKYDPLTQKDFYSLYAFFNNLDAEPETQREPPQGLQPPFISLATAEQERRLADFDKRLKRLARDLDAAKKAVAEEEDDEEDSERKKPLEKAVKELESQHKSLKRERDQFDRSILKAMVMKEREQIRPAFIYTRGQYDAPGAKVERDTPGFLPPLKRSGDIASRMDLAEWFVDRDNPLTARVAVNRFWQQFFGVGLVKTSEDLGPRAKCPVIPNCWTTLPHR